MDSGRVSRLEVVETGRRRWWSDAAKLHPEIEKLRRELQGQRFERKQRLFELQF